MQKEFKHLHLFEDHFRPDDTLREPIFEPFYWYLVVQSDRCFAVSEWFESYKTETIQTNFVEIYLSAVLCDPIFGSSKIFDSVS